MLEMNQGEEIFLILCLLYLSDCILWVRRGSVAIVGGLFKVSPKMASPIFGTGRWGLIPLNVLPPSGRAFNCHFMPFSISPFGISITNSRMMGDPISRDPLYHSFETDGKGTITRNEDEVHINNRKWYVFGNSDQAKRIASLLIELMNMPMQMRNSVIQKYWDDQFNYDEALTLLIQFRGSIKNVVPLTYGLFLLIFIVSPLTAYMFGLAIAIIVLVPLVFGLSIILSIKYNLLARLNNSQSRHGRIIEIIRMIGCPPIAIRVLDLISLDLLSKYNCSLISHMFMSDDQYREYASKLYRNLKYPIGESNMDEEERKIFRSDNGYATAAMERFLLSRGYDPLEFMRAPSVKSETSRSYCPRCLSEFTFSIGKCSDCDGIELQLFENDESCGGGRKPSGPRTR